MMSNELGKALEDLILMTHKHETLPSWALGLKLAEEVGEVAEALMVDNGFSRHKVLEEDVLHEVADVINVCIGLVTQHYPDLEPHEISLALTDALIKKGKKYKKVLKDGANG